MDLKNTKKRFIKNFIAASAFYFYNSFITHCPIYSLRKFYLTKVLGYTIGNHTAIHMGCFVTGKHIAIGKNSIINRNCYLDGRGGLNIGNNVSISPECYIISLTHDANCSQFSAIAKPVRIEDRTWIGAKALINPGVHLAEGVVVGSGAVVTKSFDAFNIIAGVPAKKIGDRSKNLNYINFYFPFFNGDILSK